MPKRRGRPKAKIATAPCACSARPAGSSSRRGHQASRPTQPSVHTGFVHGGLILKATRRPSPTAASSTTRYPACGRFTSRGRLRIPHFPLTGHPTVPVQITSVPAGQPSRLDLVLPQAAKAHTPFARRPSRTYPRGVPEAPTATSSASAAEATSGPVCAGCAPDGCTPHRGHQPRRRRSTLWVHRFAFSLSAQASRRRLDPQVDEAPVITAAPNPTALTMTLPCRRGRHAIYPLSDSGTKRPGRRRST